jgi:ParB/RepB/Spo0J family partition protein
MSISLLEIPIETIVFGERFREEYKNIDDLASSMKREGVIQPLAVRANEDGTYNLLAGGRRYTAALKAGLTSLPVRCYPPTLSELEMREIELMENVCREDLTWYETAKLRSTIHDIRVAMYGEKVSTAADAPGESKRDTAKVLGVTPIVVSQDINLVKASKAFPQLAEAKTRKDAQKMLEKLKEQMIQSELAKRIEEKTASTPLEKIHLDICNRYIVGDFLQGVKDIPSGSIDFIEMDPPYGINLTKVKREMSTAYTPNYNEVDETVYADFLSSVISECKRVMTENSWMIIWHAKEWRADIQSFLRDISLSYDEGIWYKGPVGQTNTPAIHLASSFEPFLYVRKGSPSISRQGRSNVFHYKPVYPGAKIHPTERPIEMIQDLMQTFCWEGARILVPFLGSGNSILAASNLGMKAFGWDLSQEYKDAYTLRVHESRPTSYRSYKEETVCLVS